jgi:uncharacterized protein with GYD domain
MGTVYLAFDPRVRRRVALKTFIVPPHLTAEERRDRQERFLREAQAAGALSHPGIVTIFEVDEDALCDLPFIAMEYVPGETLHHLIAEQGSLPADRVREIAVTLSGALDVAHRAGVVHRDIKPANVLVRDPDGAVKITDFGVARVSTSELTHTGAPVGSPAYMSPEQLRGDTVDGRSDLFSLAAVLYLALCGERPFSGDDIPSVTYSIVHQDPIPLSQRVSGLPDSVDRFFARALAKEPSSRYPNATTFAIAFEQALTEGAPSPTAAAATRPMVETPVEDPPQPDGAGHAATGVAPRGPGRMLAWAAATVVVIVLAGWGLASRGSGDTAAKPDADAAVVATEEGPSDASLVDRAKSVLGIEKEAYLALEARSSVKEGTLTLLVDGSEVFSRSLSTEDRSMKRFFKKVSGKVHESFETRIPVSAGRHEVVAIVETRRSETPYEDSVTIDMEPGEIQTITLVAGRTFGSPLTLKAP